MSGFASYESFNNNYLNTLNDCEILPKDDTTLSSNDYNKFLYAPDCKPKEFSHQPSTENIYQYIDRVFDEEFEVTDSEEVKTPSLSSPTLKELKKKLALMFPNSKITQNYFPYNLSSVDFCLSKKLSGMASKPCSYNMDSLYDECIPVKSKIRNASKNINFKNGKINKYKNFLDDKDLSTKSDNPYQMLENILPYRPNRKNYSSSASIIGNLIDLSFQTDPIANADVLISLPLSLNSDLDKFNDNVDIEDDINLLNLDNVEFENNFSNFKCNKNGKTISSTSKSKQITTNGLCNRLEKEENADKVHLNGASHVPTEKLTYFEDVEKISPAELKFVNKEAHTCPNENMNDLSDFGNLHYKNESLSNVTDNSINPQLQSRLSSPQSCDFCDESDVLSRGSPPSESSILNTNLDKITSSIDYPTYDELCNDDGDEEFTLVQSKKFRRNQHRQQITKTNRNSYYTTQTRYFRFNRNSRPSDNSLFNQKQNRFNTTNTNITFSASSSLTTITRQLCQDADCKQLNKSNKVMNEKSYSLQSSSSSSSSTGGCTMKSKYPNPVQFEKRMIKPGDNLNQNQLFIGHNRQSKMHKLQNNQFKSLPNISPQSGSIVSHDHPNVNKINQTNLVIQAQHEELAKFFLSTWNNFVAKQND